MIAEPAVEATGPRPSAGDSNRRLPWRSRLALGVQSLVVRLAGPITITGIGLAMRFLYGFTFHELRDIRRRFKAELKANPGPVLIAANHLTFVDSPILTWGLAPTWWYVLRSAKMPWNTPERSNFAASPMTRVVVYLFKCLPITRGGDRKAVTLVLDKLAHLLKRGHLVLMFPEGRRSRTGRIDRTHAAHGVGRLVKAVPGMRVLCVYLRGDHQDEYSLLPAKGETFHLATSWLEPATDKKGLRGSVDITDQILTRLEEMEGEYFQSEMSGSAVGNDVVDLDDPETIVEELNPRFDERVFTAAELRRLAVADDVRALRWILWAAKESAYKLAKRRDPETVFAHSLFRTDLGEDGCGTVRHGEWCCAVEVKREGSTIHAIATTGHGDRERVVSGVKEIPLEIDPSLGAREFATWCVARHLDVELNTVTITKKSDRIPVLRIDGQSRGSLSLSHHGKLVAFAWNPVT